MASFVVFILFLTITLCMSSEDKTHDVWLTRMEFGTTDPSWVANEVFKLHKIDRNHKSLSLNLTLMREVNENNLLCEVKSYENHGGKYAKGLLHIPKTPCCALIADDKLVWRCLREKANFPEACPLPVGDYQLKEFDPDLCDYPKVLPPTGAEDCKIEFLGFADGKQIFKHVGYGMLKKRTQLV